MLRANSTPLDKEQLQPEGACSVESVEIWPNMLQHPHRAQEAKDLNLAGANIPTNCRTRGTDVWGEGETRKRPLQALFHNHKALGDGGISGVTLSTLLQMVSGLAPW